jgi:hypothetical protein
VAHGDGTVKSAYACHSSALAVAFRSFFGSDEIPFSLDSRVAGTIRQYARYVVKHFFRRVTWD